MARRRAVDTHRMDQGVSRNERGAKSGVGARDQDAGNRGLAPSGRVAMGSTYRGSCFRLTWIGGDPATERRRFYGSGRFAPFSYAVVLWNADWRGVGFGAVGGGLRQ